MLNIRSSYVHTPVITVGIPFFNAEKTLLDAIKSIFAQTFQQWELILVDDGSTDGSLEIARSISDPRVRLLAPDGKNRRLPFRLNQIAQNAKGEYLARMDADDLCHPERFARQLSFLQNHPEIDVVGSSACLLDKNGHLVNKKLVFPEGHNDIFKNKFKRGVSIIHPSVMAKSEWFRQWPYDENNIRCEDYELWLRCCKHTVFANLPDLLCFRDEFLSFALSKYAKSNQTVATVIWQYAPEEIRRLKTVYYAGKPLIHIVVYAMALCIGVHSKLINRRYSSMTPEECAEVNAALDVIRNTEVPIQKR